MERAHRKRIDFGNPVRNVVGQPFYGEKPPAKKVLEEIISAMADASTGTCWMPVEVVADDKHNKHKAWNLMLKQCPGACGHVWKLILKDKTVSAWLVNEINQRRHGKDA